MEKTSGHKPAASSPKKGKNGNLILEVVEGLGSMAFEGLHPITGEVARRVGDFFTSGGGGGEKHK